MLTHLENEAAQIEATLRASLATETVAASPVSRAASSPSADTPNTIVADSPPASAASVRTLEQLHEARAQIALLSRLAPPRQKPAKEIGAEECRQTPKETEDAVGRHVEPPECGNGIVLRP